MIEAYYQRELSRLRDLAAEFSKAHPALAPLLSGQSADPDVERILEGTAFLSGLVYERLDDDFPEFIHGLTGLLCPHYLRPVPAATIIRFTPKRSLRETFSVPAGTMLASREIEGTSCLFATSYDVALAPLTLTEARWSASRAGRGSLRLEFSLTGMELADLQGKSLRVYCAGDYPSASQRYWLFFDRLAEVRFVPGSGGSTALCGKGIRPVGFSEPEALIPFPVRSFPGYRILQEYFTLPEKFLFFEFDGFDMWRDRGRGSSFAVECDFENLPPETPALRREHFELFATPSLNVFPHQADPIALDHRRAEYLIRPSGSEPRHYQVYSVDRVTGVERGTVKECDYLPFQIFNPMVEGVPVYSLHTKLSALDNRSELYLSVSKPGGTLNEETLSVRLRCTNASLPEQLRSGDICRPTSSSPELADFTNLRPPTAPAQPPLGRNMIWRLLSHIFLNYHSVATAENLRALLKLYIFAETRDRAGVIANSRRVEAVSSVNCRPAERFVRGHLARGQEIRLALDRTGFAGTGDMYLFGAVLDVFFANYAAVNAYTRLTLEDTQRKESFTWPERLGDRPLL